MLRSILEWLANIKTTEDRTKAEDAERRARETESANLERRMSALEKANAELNTKVFDHQKWIGTTLVSVIAIVLTIVGIGTAIISRIDVKDSTGAMERRVNSAIGDMQKDFALLAGDALKKPSIRIDYQGQQLDGQTLETGAGMMFSSQTIFLHNAGEKLADHISIRLYTSAKVYPNNGRWYEESSSSDTNYPFSFLYGAPVSINAQDDYLIEPFGFQLSASPTKFKLQVYYNGTTSVANFSLAIKK
jgi:hypothetical protein